MEVDSWEIYGYLSIFMTFHCYVWLPEGKSHWIIEYPMKHIYIYTIYIIIKYYQILIYVSIIPLFPHLNSIISPMIYGSLTGETDGKKKTDFTMEKSHLSWPLRCPNTEPSYLAPERQAPTWGPPKMTQIASFRV